MSDSKEPLAEKTKQLLDQSIEHMDDNTVDELHRRRMEVLKAAAEKPTPGMMTYAAKWVPAGGLAAACVATVVWFSLPSAKGPSLDQVDVVVVDQILVEENGDRVWEESFEMLEDLEFYSWLSEEPHV